MISKKLQKARDLRKRVKREKARLRKLGPKKHKKIFKCKHVRIRFHIEPKTRAQIEALAEVMGVKPYKIIRKALGNFTKLNDEEIVKILTEIKNGKK